jgi:RNA polymerase sigma-70 factor, ECF subfamily
VSATPKAEASRGDGTTRSLGTLLDREGAERPAEREWRALVESVAAADQPALRALYDRTHRIVFTLIMRIVDNRESAEELTADVYHEVWRRAAQYDSAAGSVLGWIMNLARSRAIDRVRFDHRKKRFGPHADAPTEPSGDPCSETLELTQRRQAVREALQVLTPEEREVIETAFFSEMTYAEVADSLDQPPGTVKTRIRSGLTKLRIALASAGEGV